MYQTTCYIAHIVVDDGRGSSEVDHVLTGVGVFQSLYPDSRMKMLIAILFYFMETFVYHSSVVSPS